MRRRRRLRAHGLPRRRDARHGRAQVEAVARGVEPALAVALGVVRRDDDARELARGRVEQPRALGRRLRAARLARRDVERERRAVDVLAVDEHAQRVLARRDGRVPALPRRLEQRRSPRARARRGRCTCPSRSSLSCVVPSRGAAPPRSRSRRARPSRCRTGRSRSGRAAAPGRRPRASRAPRRCPRRPRARGRKRVGRRDLDLVRRPVDGRARPPVAHARRGRDRDGVPARDGRPHARAVRAVPPVVARARRRARAAPAARAPAVGPVAARRARSRAAHASPSPSSSASCASCSYETRWRLTSQRSPPTRRRLLLFTSRASISKLTTSPAVRRGSAGRKRSRARARRRATRARCRRGRCSRRRRCPPRAHPRASRRPTRERAACVGAGAIVTVKGEPTMSRCVAPTTSVPSAPSSS